MVYVQRDQDGRIVAVSREPQFEGWESLPGDTSEVIAFAGLLSGGQKALASTDLALARVLEDLIDLLLAQQVVRLTDFPQAAQEKLLARRSIRSSLGSLNLLEKEGKGGVL